MRKWGLTARPKWSWLGWQASVIVFEIAGLTLAQLLARWHHDVLRHQLSVSTAANYKSVFDHHLVPALGR